MNQPVEVLVSELHSASTSLADAAQRLQDGLTSVNDETTELLGSGWKGGAASAYAPAWEQWNDGAKKVVEGLQRMSELLDIAGKEYAKTDRSAAEGVGSTMQDSGGSGGSSGTGGSPSGAAGGASDSGSASGTGAADRASGATSSAGQGIGQALGSVSQLGQAAMQPLSQVGQPIGGLASTAAQLASGLAEKAGAEDPAEGETDEVEKRDSTGTSREQAAGTAPVDARLQRPDEVQRAVERPSD